MTSATDAASPAVPPLTWVLGASGLLGSAVVREHVRRGGRVQTSRVPWHDHEAAVATLLEEAAALPSSGWRIAWCAGVGVVATSQEVLDAEVRVVEEFLDRWEPPAGEGQRAVFLASSAGGVYAGSQDPPFTEHHAPRPLAPYGHAKLRIEGLFAAHAERHGLGLVVGRIANLYGPGQDLRKAQGLISMLCDKLVNRGQVTIYVSLDTLRDYLFVDDAAAMVAAALDAVSERGGVHVKLMASGRALSIGEILGQLTRVARRRPPVLLGTSPSARFQVRDLRLRSVMWPDLDHLVRTPVPVGIAACLGDAEASLRRASVRSAR